MIGPMTFFTELRSLFFYNSGCPFTVMRYVNIYTHADEETPPPPPTRLWFEIVWDYESVRSSVLHEMTSHIWGK